MPKSKTFNEDILEIKRERERKAAQNKRTLAKLANLKLGLLIAVPIVYFLFSPLLLFVVAAYGATFFIARKLESQLNHKMPAKSHTIIPKADSVIALVIVGVATLSMLISMIATVGSPSIYEGVADDELLGIIKVEDSTLTLKQREEVIAELHESGITMPRALRYTLQELTLFSGYRLFFMEQSPNVLGAFGEKLSVSREADTGVADYSKSSAGGFLDFMFILIQVLILSLVSIGAFWFFRTKYPKMLQ